MLLGFYLATPFSDKFCMQHVLCMADQITNYNTTQDNNQNIYNFFVVLGFR